MTAPAVARRPPLTGRSAEAANRELVRLAGAVLRGALAGLRRVAPSGAAVMTVLVAHAALGPHLAVAGTAPDVVLAAVVAVALGRGSRAAAAFGFVAGLGADLFLTTPLGATALAATLIGHAVGTMRPAGASGAAGVLCGPGSTCFSCRTGRVHRPGGAVAPGALRTLRSRQRAVGRRRARRRSLVLTGLGVGAGQLGAAMVATAFGGTPFPGAGALGGMAAAALVSAPFGPPLLAGVRRLGGINPGEGG